MNAQLILNFDNQDDLIRVLRLLKEIGLNNVAVESGRESVSQDKVVESTPEAVENDAYEEAQLFKGDVPMPIFSLDKYSVYEQ